MRNGGRCFNSPKFLLTEPTLTITAVCGARLGELEPTLLAAARILDATPSYNLVLEATATVLADQAPDAAATLRGATDATAPGYGEYASQRGNAAAIAAETATAAYQTGRRMTDDEAAAFARTLIRDALTTLRSPNHPR